VRELEDGRVLAHCFAGCGIEAVLAAAGVPWDALFAPESAIDRKPPLRQRYLGADVVRAIANEALVVATAAANVAHGVELGEEDRERLMRAAERLAAAVRESGYANA